MGGDGLIAPANRSARLILSRRPTGADATASSPTDDNYPTPAPAKDDAFFPSPSSLGQFTAPRKLSDVIAASRGAGSDDIAVFIPGGHGALMGLPEGEDMKAVLDWAAARDRFVISLRHGPAAFLSVGARDGKICAVPDALDARPPDIGSMPGHLTWKFGKTPQAMGFEIVNEYISGQTHRFRKMLTGDSPLAGNALVRRAAGALLDEVGKDCPDARASARMRG